MKIIILILCILLGVVTTRADDTVELTANANSAVERGNCKVLMPDHEDDFGYFCSGGFGVTYLGYKIDRFCHKTLQEAVDVMNNARVCTVDQILVNCKLLFPGQTDRSDRFCQNRRWGVTYFGHFVSRSSCYADADAALSAMEATQSCAKDFKLGECSILFPYQTDDTGRYCDRSFGVTYRGTKIDQYCYETIDEAHSVMTAATFCQ